jgi:hypothetical protein
MANHLRRKISGLKRKLKQSARKAQARMSGVSDSNAHNVTVARGKNSAVVVNTCQTASSQMTSSNQVAHINQEIS